MMNERSINNPTCPHCGYEFDEEQTWCSEYKPSGKVETGDGDTSELVCPDIDCAKSFAVVCVHYITFEQADED